MHPDQAFLVTVVKALQEAKLEAIVVGATAAVLQGAPIMTRDIDVLIRNTPKNQEKIRRLCELLGEDRPIALGDLTSTVRIPTSKPVDLLFDRMGGDLSFEWVRSRSVVMEVGDTSIVVASLEDVILSKEAANRDKDRAQLPILRDTLRVKNAMKDKHESEP